MTRLCLPAGVCNGLIALCLSGAVSAGTSGEPPIFADGFETSACVPPYATAFPFEWNTLYPQGWPGYNHSVRFTPPALSYVTLRFTAGPAGQVGELLGTPIPPGANSVGLVSISRTPGCFDPAHTGPRCISDLAQIQSVTWTTGNSPFRCELVPGQTYYVNLTLGGDQGPGPYCPRELEYCILELGQTLN